MELSRREKEILAQIADEFTPKEAGLVDALNAGPARRLWYSPAVRIWLSLLGVLAVGLVLIPLGMLLFGLGLLGVGVLTLGVVTPWTVLAVARLARATTGK